MGRPSKGVRLWWRKDDSQWVILDGKTQRRTGTADRGKAERFMRAYIEALGPRGSGFIGSDATDVPAEERHTYHPLRRAKHRATSRGLPFDITEEYITGLIERQGRACAVSGIPFQSRKSETGRRLPFAPSIDRIDNAGGYTMDNVRIVASIVNNAMADYSDAEFFEMCKAVVGSGKICG